jgi:hypothetical protein
MMAGKKRKKPGRSGELVLVGGGKPQMRERSAKSWGKKKEQLFLSVLAETCNVTRACEQAGVSVSAVYRRRREDAAFRAAWLAAISIAYQQLELVLLERAFVGTDKLVSVRGGEPQIMREYSNTLGLGLLRMHRDSAAAADTEFQPEQIEELRERLFSKLQRLRKRGSEEKDESPC